MALIRDLVILTFDQNDDRDEKLNLLKQYLANGYKVISEIKLDETGEIKEWVLQGKVIYGKFQEEHKSNLLKFDAAKGIRK